MGGYIYCLKRYSEVPLQSDYYKVEQLELVPLTFHVYEKGEAHRIHSKAHPSTQNDMALRFYHVPDLLHEDGVGNTSCFMKLAKVPSGCAKRYRTQEDSMMAGLYVGFNSRTRKGFIVWPGSNWWKSRHEFTSSTLNALLARENRVEIIAQHKLRPVLDRCVPLCGIQVLADYLSRRTKGRLLGDSLGL
jgi:hypothetical protein